MPDDLRALRRQQIIAAARVIVARDGFDALTFAELEKKLPYSRGVITYHFKNKEEIVDALLGSAIEEIDGATRAEVAAAQTQDERARAMVGAVVRGFLSRVEAVRVLVAFWGRLQTDARVRAANARLYARYRRQAREVLGCDAATAAVIVGVVLGIAAQSYFEPGALDVDAAIEQAGRAVASLVTPSRRAARGLRRPA